MIQQVSKTSIGDLVLKKFFCLGFALTLSVLSDPCHAEDIPLKREGGVYVLQALVNDSTILKFILDSGASTTSISSAEFLVLIKNGTIGKQDMLSDAIYTLADGSEVKQHRVILRKLQVGSVIVRDVEATVASDPTSGLLLGQSFLRRLPSWGLNNERDLLVITGVTKSVHTAKYLQSTTPVNKGANPSNGRANLARGQALLKKNDYQGAIDEFSRAIQLEPQCIEALLGRARARICNCARADDAALLRIGAADDYTRILQIDPKYISAYLGRGYIRYLMCQYEGAQEDFSKAIEIDPRCFYAYVTRGNLRSDISDYQGALEDYDRAIEIDPKQASLCNRAYVLKKLGR